MFRRVHVAELRRFFHSRSAAFGAHPPLLRRSTNAENCPLTDLTGIAENRSSWVAGEVRITSAATGSAARFPSRWRATRRHASCSVFSTRFRVWCCRPLHDHCQSHVSRRSLDRRLGGSQQLPRLPPSGSSSQMLGGAQRSAHIPIRCRMSWKFPCGALVLANI
jgi:hypothetical protein